MAKTFKTTEKAKKTKENESAQILPLAAVLMGIFVMSLLFLGHLGAKVVRIAEDNSQKEITALIRAEYGEAEALAVTEAAVNAANKNGNR